MKLLNQIIEREEGLALPAVLVLLLLGGLITTPLLTYMSAGIKTGQVYEGRMYEIYAADAGVEDAFHKLFNYDSTLMGLDPQDSYSYNLPSEVNGLPVGVTVTKLDLLEGVIDPDEYKEDQPHEGWINFDAPVQVEKTADYVEYSCNITFHYEGTGSRRLEILGAGFYRYFSGEILVDGPHDVVPTPIITFNDLQAGSPETHFPPGGLCFVWKWEDNRGPRFDQNNRDGAVEFKFKVYDPDWVADINLAFATIREQDVSYITNRPTSYKWLIESTAGDTLVRVGLINDIGRVDILAWEVNLQ